MVDSPGISKGREKVSAAFRCKVEQVPERPHHVDVTLVRVVWLIAAFLCGAIVLYLVAMLSGLEDQHKMKVLRKRVLALEEQVAAMTQTSSSSAGQTSEGGSSSAGQTPEGRLSVADTPPLMPMPGVMNTPQPDGRIPSAPLSPLQNFRQ